MNKLAILALAAALALGACAEANAPEADDDMAATDTADTTVITPTATETVVADPVEGEEGSSLMIDGGDVDATVSEDGVDAEIQVD